MPSSHHLEVLILGTDTEVGKTTITGMLCKGLRSLSRPVWIHKPVACGDWDGQRCAEATRLLELVGDGQDPATVCPIELREAAAPSVAAEAEGRTVLLDQLVATARSLRGGHDLLIESAGGLLSPLTTDRASACDLALRLGLPVLLVTRAQLGTINHTALAVSHLRRLGIPLFGLILNHHRPTETGLATRTVARELALCTGCSILREVRHGEQGEMVQRALAEAVLSHRID